MAVRVATFTVTVKYNDARFAQPGHLLGGMKDEILGWNEDGRTEGYKVEVSDTEFETEAQAARREALLMVGIGLDDAANNRYSNGDAVLQAVTRWTTLAGRPDTFAAYTELQREAMAQGHGVRK
jgi:hypothetical protein